MTCIIHDSPKSFVDYFMAKDQAILRRNKMFWHYAMNDFMFTTIRVISKHHDTQVYGAILPQHLTNQAMTKPTQAFIGKRIKTSAKGDKPAKKKQSAIKSKGLTVLSEVALTVAELMKIALKRSKIQTHSSHASGSGADEGTGIKLGVPDVPTYKSDDEQISWKSSEEEDDDKVSLNDDDDNDDDDDGADNQDDADQEDDGQDDKDQDDVNEKIDSDNDGTNVEEEELDEEETNDEDEANKLYRDVNVNLEGRDIEMIDAQQTNVQTTQVIKDTHVIITPVNPEGIDSIFYRNTESTSLIDVLVTTIAEPALLSTTTLPPPPTPLITHLQQTPVTTLATVPSSSLQDLPNFGSLFGIVDAYLANKMHEAVKIVVQLQSERLKDEAQAEIADFINKIDDNIKKIIKDQVKEQVKAQVCKILLKIQKTVNEQLEAKVLTRSSNESKTSHVVAANLSKLELKKIPIDKMESNKSIHRSDAQKNLYKALVDAYERDKLILDTYGETISFKRRRDEEDKDEEPSAGSN
ncbi:hypothetical protein Tco_0548411 [Tanacetum coccineum]